MGFFNDLSKKTSETTSKIARETKLKMKLNENKNKIEDIYLEIGKKMYQKHLREEVIYGDLTDDFTNIDNLGKEIEEAKEELLKLNQKKLCSKCRTEILLTAQFCPKCGEKQPEEQPVVETTAVEKTEAQQPVTEQTSAENNPEAKQEPQTTENCNNSDNQ